MITVLAGGVGAARFLEGLRLTWPEDDITVISNVGDDLEVYGVHVSPDIDIVLYSLAGMVDRRGWGVMNDTFHFIDALERFGYETWFRLGDRDYATSVFRSRRLAEGASLSAVSAEIARSLGVRLRLLPITDDPLRTMVSTTAGMLEFQDYFVRRRTQDEVLKIAFAGEKRAKPAPGVLDAIAEADAVILAPSNPLVSIGPILAVSGVRAALRETRARIAAISPIIRGGVVKGPADRMMRSLGLEASALQVARLYEDFLDVFVLDVADAELADGVAELKIQPVVTETIMSGLEEKRRLAAATVRGLGLALP
ncbi:MAG: 2-phospho-L-lactate transferase [Dehalococcoidia bacterium]|nr:2-phospho-L-lactate transferase [Dehalococcoidia bacterium]